MRPGQYLRFTQKVYDHDYFHGIGEKRVNYVDAVGDGWHEKLGKQFAKIFDLVGAVVVDGGCACGANTIEFVKNGAKKVYGVDVSDYAINFAKQNNQRPEIQYENAELHLMPFIDSESIDFYYSGSVFEHLNPKYNKDTVAEINRILKPGGIALIEACMLSGNEKVYVPPPNDDPGHINVIHIREWQQIFAMYPRLKEDLEKKALANEVLKEYHWTFVIYRKN